MSAITVFNVFYNCGVLGATDVFVGAYPSETEAEKACDEWGCENDWDPYFSIVSATSPGEFLG